MNYRTHVRIGPRTTWRVVLPGLAGVWLALFFLPGKLVMAAFVVFLLLLMDWSTTLTIGDEGVSLRRFLRERFIPYSEIESVQAVETADPDQRAVQRIALVSGGRIKLEQWTKLQSRFGVQLDQPVLARARDALQRYRDRAGRAPALPRLLSAPSDGSPVDRVRALTAKKPDTDAYRESGADESALRVAVDEPTLPPRVRAEAAIALGAAQGADDLERIRRVAEPSACRPLRELFDAVADGAGEAKLSRALGRVP